MDTSDLLKICPIAAYPTPGEKPVIVLALVFTTSQCHTHKKEKKAVGENLDLMHISFHYITEQTRYYIGLDG